MKSSVIRPPVDPERSTRYLYWWLLLALFFEYARPASFVPGLAALPLNSVIPMGLLVACLFASGVRSWADIKADPGTKWVVIYLGIITFSVVTARVSMYALGVFIVVLGYFFLWVIITRVVTTVSRVYGVFAALIAAHLFLIAMNPEVVTNPTVRNYVKGATFLGDGNDFALSLCILLPMAVAVGLSAGTNLGRLFGWGCLLLLALAIVGSSSRGGTLGMCAVAAYIWTKSPRKGLTLLGLGVVAVGALAYAPETYFNRMNTVATYQEDGSAMGRINAWKSAARMFADNPVFGVGAGNFPNSFGTKYKPPGVDNIRWKTAHSIYFLILGELALPGIITLLMLILGNLRQNSLAMRQVSSGTDPPTTPAIPKLALLLFLLSASLIGFAVAGAFLSAAYYPHIFVLSALSISVRRLMAAEKVPVAAARVIRAGASAPARPAAAAGR